MYLPRRIENMSKCHQGSQATATRSDGALFKHFSSCCYTVDFSSCCYTDQILIDISTFAVQWFELGTKCTIFSALTTGHNPLSVQSVSCNGQWECVSNVVCINFQTKPRYSDIVGGISVCFALWWGLSPFKYTGGGGGTIIQYKILQQCGAVTRGDWVES